MKARKKKAAQRAAKRTTEITEKVAANAEDKKAEVVDSTEKTAAAQDTTKKEVKVPEVKAEPAKEEKEPVKEEKKPEVKAEPVKEEKKTEAKVEPVKEEKKPEVKAEPVKKETEKAESTKELEQEFERRMARHYDELKWLYCELYENRMDMFEDLCKNLKNIYMDRKPDLKKQDRVREQNPEWYKKNDILGMMMYVNAFAGNLKGVKEKLDYVQECNVNYLHLMPLLESPEGKSDGGYAVSDFRKVQPELGTMEDLESLADECRKKGISLCMDFVMNHTSEDHEWARRARAGEREYMDRYYFYDNYDVPSQFEQTVPQVFPTTAPGNFTWLDDIKKFVMTTFYPYQWDLNYWNPVVMNEMIYNMLNLTNKGIDVIRIDAVPYIWKQLGTNCRNLPQVHSIVRMLRMILEMVCPGVILKGEVVMEPKELPVYFGTEQEPECHMLYGVSSMVNLWAALATRDTRMLKHQMDVIHSLPKNCYFVNYLRCHDDIGWGLDEEQEKKLEIDPIQHKEYLYHFFEGTYPYSFARGELYNYDPVTKDARSCGTTASLCGIEKGGFEGDLEQVKQGIQRVLMMHAACMSMEGFVMLSSGDEIGQVNDYNYKKNPDTAADSRYLHRSPFQWENAEKRKKPGTVQYAIWNGLKQMEEFRREENCFGETAGISTWDTGNSSVFAIRRTAGREELICLANFSEYGQNAWLNCLEGEYEDLFTGEKLEMNSVWMNPYQYRWCVKK